MVVTKVHLIQTLGFRDGTASAHTSRTMMLEELALLLDKVPVDAAANAYVVAITTENVLGKPTQTTRRRTAKILGQLYTLDPSLAGPQRVWFAVYDKEDVRK